LAGVENCSLRNGDMYDLAFADGEFDTVILDDVLDDAERPMVAIAEARRILKPAGRLLLLSQADQSDAAQFEKQMAVWCGAAGLRLASPRRVPAKNPRWIVAVASPAGHKSAAA